MKLHNEWRLIIRHAWSVRLIVLAGLLSMADVGLSLARPDWLDLPAWAFAVVSAVISGTAVVARLVAQKEVFDATQHSPPKG